MNANEFNPREDPRFQRHMKLVQRYLSQINEYGYFAIHSFTVPTVNLPDKRLRETFLDTGRVYSEAISHAEPAETHPDGYTFPYRIKTKLGQIASQLATCYFDGYIVTDGYIDIFGEDDDGFNPYWFAYKIQRHLELTKEVFDDLADNIICVIVFSNIEKFKWEIFKFHRIYEKKPYAGYHDDIIFPVDLKKVHGRSNWNIKMDIVEVAMNKIARIFGMDGIPQPYWNNEGELDYPFGMPGR